MDPQLKTCLQDIGKDNRMLYWSQVWESFVSTVIFFSFSACIILIFTLDFLSHTLLNTKLFGIYFSFQITCKWMFTSNCSLIWQHYSFQLQMVLLVHLLSYFFMAKIECFELHGNKKSEIINTCHDT